MQIRLATQHDIEQLPLLFNNFAKEVYRLAGRELVQSTESDFVSGQKKLIAEMISSSNQHILIAQEEQDFIGLLHFYTLQRPHKNDKMVIINNFFVDPKYQKQGIGGQMFTWVKQWCLDQNIHVIKLDSGLELTGAHKFYEKQGGVFTEKMYRFDF